MEWWLATERACATLGDASDGASQNGCRLAVGK